MYNLYLFILFLILCLNYFLVSFYDEIYTSYTYVLVSTTMYIVKLKSVETKNKNKNKKYYFYYP